MPDAVHVGSGKVRELYALDDERLLLVASDRISTFDVVLPTEIPDKGRVLTGLSGFWFRLLGGIVIPPARSTVEGISGSDRTVTGAGLTWTWTTLSSSSETPTAVIRGARRFAFRSGR